MDLDRLLRMICPETLREQFRLPHASWREEFVARFLMTDSHEAMVNELGRFVGHVKERWVGRGVAWDADRARSEAVRLLHDTLGDGLNPKAGELAAMQLCRHGDRGGMRYLLDELSWRLLKEGVEQYLDYSVLPEIYRLSPEESLKLAKAYLATCNVVPGLSLEGPAGVALRWRQVVHQHAKCVLQR